MVHVAKLSFNNDPNVGLYGVATDKFCLLGKSVPEKNVKEIEEALHVPVIQVTVYGTPLIGIFIAATSDTVLVPDVIFDHELKELKQKLKGIAEVKTFKTELTALANNILLNDKVAIISAEYAKPEAKKLAEELKVKFLQMDLAGLNVPGSAAVLTNKGALFTSNLSDSEIYRIEKLLGFEIGLGSVNTGSPIIRSAVIANSFGFIVGDLSSGYEIGRLDESLGFLQ